MWLIEVQEDMYNRTGQFKKLVITNNRVKDFVDSHLVFSCNCAKCWGYKTEWENVSQFEWKDIIRKIQQQQETDKLGTEQASPEPQARVSTWPWIGVTRPSAQWWVGGQQDLGKASQSWISISFWGEADVRRVSILLKSLEWEALARTSPSLSKPSTKTGLAELTLAELKIKSTGSERGERDLKLGSKAGYFPFLKCWGWHLVGHHSEGMNAGHLRTGPGGRKPHRAFLPSPLGAEAVANRWPGF